MASRREIHASRIPDILMGMVLNGMKKKARDLALRTKYSIASGRSNFNDVIRSKSPSIYLVDPSLIASVLITEIFNETGNSPYITKIYTETGPVEYKESGYSKAYSQLITSQSAEILKLQKTLTKSITVALEQRFKSRITTESMLNLAEKVYNEMVEALEKASKKSRRVYADFRAAAAKGGAEIRRELNIKGISLVSDPENFIDNVNNRLVFLSYSFNTSIAEINKTIQAAVATDIERSSLSQLLAISKIDIGNLVNAGHVGIYQDNSLLGINMPSGIIAGVASNQLEKIEQAIGSIPIHLEHGIRLNKNFVDKAGIFLDLQFNFAVSMEGTINTKDLNIAEQQAIKSIVGNIGEEALLEVLNSKAGDKIFADLAELIPESKSSKSIVDHIEDTVLGILKGTKIPNFKQSKSFAGKSVNGNSVKVSGNKKPIKKAISKPKLNVKPVVKPQTTNLVKLQNLINQSLVERIKQNMGRGERRDVLNLRSGRFAESVKIERMTQSREGMITAFYSYMKNPYATFSEGGLQSSPRTRDPKLLIARSIRDIASQQVQNRLRSVSV